MSITSRGGYQILDFKGQIAKRQGTSFVNDPELYEICKKQKGKKIFIAYNGYMIDDGVREDVTPSVISEITFSEGSDGIPDGCTVYLYFESGGEEVTIYNKEEEK